MGDDDDDDYVSEGDMLADQYGVWVYVAALQFGRSGGLRLHFSVANDEKTEEEYYVFSTLGAPITDVWHEARFGRSASWLAVNPAATVRSFSGVARLKLEPYSATSYHLTLSIGAYSPVKFRMLELQRSFMEREVSGRSERLLGGITARDILRMW